MTDLKFRIRAALIQIAERLGRPHYEPMTVRDVLSSFDNGTDHLLKDLVIHELRPVQPELEKVSIDPLKAKFSQQEVKKSILALAQHGTITKFKSGCHCEECMEWA